MPVHEIHHSMPYEELLGWFTFFKKRPVGWREDQRTYLTLRSAGVKADAEDLFVSLRQLKDNIPAEEKALPSGDFLKRMLEASGGDEGWSPPWLKQESE